MTTTVDIPGPTTAKKFAVACAYAAVVAVLNLVVTFTSTNPAYAAYGSIALAFIGALNVWYVRNRMYVVANTQPAVPASAIDATAANVAKVLGDSAPTSNQLRISALEHNVELMGERIDGLQIVLPGLIRTGDTWATEPEDTAVTSDEDVGTGRTNVTERD